MSKSYIYNQEKIKAALSPTIHFKKDGSFYRSADVKYLCSIGYNYRGTENTRYLAIMEDENGTKLHEVFHFTGSEQTFSSCNPNGLCIYPKTRGLNLYYNPQEFKRPWIEPEKFWNMSPKEQRNWRTTKTKGHTFYGSCNFSAKDIFAYRDIVIDLDNHTDPTPWVQMSVNRLLQQIINGKVLKTGEAICRPSFVVLTGRGMQLHYEIEPVYVGGENRVRLGAKTLISYWEHILSEQDFFIKDAEVRLEVDHGASMDIGGYKRMPGSYNWSAIDPETHTFGYPVTKTAETGARFTIDTILNIPKDYIPNWTAPEATQSKESKETTNALFSHVTDEQIEEALKNTSSAIRTERWYQMACDLTKEIKAGDRNLFLFVVGCIMKDGKRNVEEIVSELNQKLSDPLDQKELRHLIKMAESGKYHFGNVNGVTRFGQPKEILKKYGLSENGCYIKNSDRARIRAKRRQERNKNILRQIRKGQSISATSRITGCARATIRKVIACYRAEVERIRNRNTGNRTNFRRFLNGLVTVALNLKEHLSQEPVFAEIPTPITS